MDRYLALSKTSKVKLRIGCSIRPSEGYSPKFRSRCSKSFGRPIVEMVQRYNVTGYKTEVNSRELLTRPSLARNDFAADSHYV